MHAEKVSEIIAHFVGWFDTLTEEIRMRQKYADGATPSDKIQDEQAAEQPRDDFASTLELKDYAPGVKYSPDGHDFDNLMARRYVETYQESLDKLTALAAQGAAYMPPTGGETTYHYADYPSMHRPEQAMHEEDPLVVHSASVSSVSHVTQAGVLRDDDYLNMTDGPNRIRDTSYVGEHLGQMTARADALDPFGDFHRTDSPAELTKIADEIHDYAQTAENQQDDETTAAPSPGTEVDFVLVADEIDNKIYVNGQEVDDVPLMSDFVPDRGIASREEVEPDDSQTTVHHEGSAVATTEVEAGANFVINIASTVETGTIAPVMAVMGNYHQIDVISQVYVYSDDDKIDDCLTKNDATSTSAATMGMNIAIFERGQYEASHDAGAGASGASSSSGEDPVFPSAWRVSVVHGDVSFVHWTEQYHFVSDNDTITMTTSGAEVSVLTGGNDAVNLATYFGFGMQYDLVIVGGNVLDMNVISQISVLYDNDTVRSEDGNGQNTTVHSGGNLLWNVASIDNIGDNDRFQSMPDYVIDTVNGIESRNPDMPTSLSAAADFQGYMGLNILYITGDLYGVNMIKQVSILGDSDDVLKAANTIIDKLPDAIMTIDTGSNVVANVAQIIDYDSFGTTTYVGGQVYSDAILIQGGLVDHDVSQNDGSQPEQASDRLANEVIAFLSDNDHDGTDATVDVGRDLSWADGHAADVMQNVVA
ncbi:hypothetical protein [Rhizobium sp. BK251]|uniref:hypothetical protein n=1 Tax=Rhizobium sp. BK251 TaxID=2512125 RepID=UPI00104782BB|nr:hypothetical protein [Rhizobium sp. BK251]TCL69522.1 hypothetical protein EV286_10894 [Rhizobium sp. BK251]